MIALRPALLVAAVLAAARPVPAACAGATAIPIAIETSLGTIHAELLPDAAPLTVGNFLRYVDGHHLDGASFYRAARPDNATGRSSPIEVIQGGVDMDRGSTLFPPVPHEGADGRGPAPLAGTLGMARDAPGTATSEFFINVADNPQLAAGSSRGDGQGYAIFGRVTSGMEVVRAIQAQPTRPMPTPPSIEGQLLVEPVRIIAIRRE